MLHFADFAQLSDARRSALVELAERRPSLLGLLLLRRNRRQGRAGRPVFRVPGRNRAAFAGRAARGARSAAAPTSSPKRAKPWWKATGGEPALLGPRLAELATDGLPESEIERELAALFTAHPHLDKLLRSVLLFGILCGEAFPPKLLLELMGSPKRRPTR